MNKGLARLLLKLKVISLDTQEIEFVFKLQKLEEIDELTFSFIDEQHFFEQYKQNILEELKKYRRTYQIQFSPTDIELIAGGISVEIGNKRIAPLFQTVPIQGKMYNILDVANKRLMQGRMYILYQADLMNQETPDYSSIFSKCPSNMMWRIKNNNQITLKDLKEFWYQLMKNSYAYSVIRFILSDEMELRIITDMKPVKKELTDYPRKKKFYWED